MDWRRSSARGKQAVAHIAPRKTRFHCSHPIVLILFLTTFTSLGVQAQALPPGWRCLDWNGDECPLEELEDPALRQILVLPTAYSEDSEQTFWADFKVLIRSLSVDSGPEVWSAQKRDLILYVGLWIPGGPLGSPEANFEARVIEDPGGQPTLATNTGEILAFVGWQQALLPWLAPLAVAVLFEGDVGAAPNAAPPSFLNSRFGIARLAAGGIQGTYISTHELGHAALGFLDEYVESGFERQDINNLQVLVARMELGGNLPDAEGVYDYNISEILAGNGAVNLAPRRNVATVGNPGSGPLQRYEHEGGMFFGRGTFHDHGSNLMNGNPYNPESLGRDFAPRHSAAQQQFIDALFEGVPARANDRLRAAGPRSGTVLQGDVVDLLLYDADKNNPFHATRKYSVQVGWWERSKGDTQAVWRSETYEVVPEPMIAYLPFTGDLHEEEVLRLVMCRAGMTDLSSAVNGYEVCDRLNDAFLPTMTFYLPYQEATVPASQWFTTYWWRFSTYNGHVWSGWTGWSSFYRSF